jgi:hypothetical protein
LLALLANARCAQRGARTVNQQHAQFVQRDRDVSRR